jgi:hypothetical protein
MSMSRTELKASYARQLLRFELTQVADQIRTQEKNAKFSLTTERAHYLRLLKRRATLMTMAISLYRRRLHAYKMVVDSAIYHFKSLRDQAQFLWSELSSPYSVLSGYQQKLVARIYDHFVMLYRDIEPAVYDGKVDLAIDGNDVMDVLGCNPGPVVGEALAFLEEQVHLDPDMNHHEKLRDMLSDEYGITRPTANNGHSNGNATTPTSRPAFKPFPISFLTEEPASDR